MTSYGMVVMLALGSDVTIMSTQLQPAEKTFTYTFTTSTDTFYEVSSASTTVDLNLRAGTPRSKRMSSSKYDLRFISGRQK